MNDYTERQVTWQGINLIVRHCPSWLSTSTEIVTQNIEVCSANREVLSITSTGYHSHFMNGEAALEAFDNDPVRHVLTWFDEAAKSREWQAKRQLNLF